jgi:hypothetical protein
MNKGHWALTAALTLAAAPLLADGASSRHPSGSSSSHEGTSSQSSSHEGASSSEGRHDSGEGHRGDSRSGHRDDHHYRGHGGVRVYGGFGAYWGSYPYYGYYDGYYGPYSGGYYGWRAPYSGYGYAYDANYGSLRIMVDPDDTEVYVDGYYAGEVDSFDGIFQRLHVRPGRHELALKRAGFRTHRVRLYVPAGGTLQVRYKMERGTGVDPREDVAGSPDSVEREEPQPREMRRPETEEPVSPTRAGELHLIVKPADAAVYVDGAFRGNAEDVADLDVPPGKHRVEVVRPGYVTFEKDVVVGPGQTVEQRVELARRGGTL